MAEFLTWINNNPQAGQVLIVAFALIAIAFCAAVIVFVWAFIIDRPIAMFGFKIPESKLVYEVGRISLPAGKRKELFERNYKGEASDTVSHRFTVKFKQPPEIVMGLVKIDGGIGIVRVEVLVDQKTREGFTLLFKTWEDSRLDNASVSWIAIGR